MAKLTKPQLATLRMLLDRPVYAARGDVCLNALQRKGMAVYRLNGARYGRSNWQITDAGRAALSDKAGEG